MEIKDTHYRAYLLAFSATGSGAIAHDKSLANLLVRESGDSVFQAAIAQGVSDARKARPGVMTFREFQSVVEDMLSPGHDPVFELQG